MNLVLTETLDDEDKSYFIKFFRSYQELSRCQALCLELQTIQRELRFSCQKTGTIVSPGSVKIRQVPT